MNVPKNFRKISVIIAFVSFVCGVFFASAYSSVVAQTLEDLSVSSVFKLTDDTSFSKLVATSTIFATEQEYRKAELEYNSNQEVLRKLDQIIRLLSKINNKL